MKHIRPIHFGRFDRMSLPFMCHLDRVVDLLGCQFKLIDDYRMDDNGSHGRGLAVHMRLISPMNIYGQTIKVLNACNEHFKERHGMKFRVGVYPEVDKPFFHIDMIQEKLFWIGRFKKDEDGISDLNSTEYKFYRDMVSFLNEVDSET